MRLFSQDSKVQALGRAPLFEGLSKKDLTELARLTEDMEVAAGKTLCKEDTLGYEFFVIVEGEVDITPEGQAHRHPRPRRLHRRDRSDRERPADGNRHGEDAAAFFVLTRQSFWGLIEHHPQVERKILTTLAKRLLRDRRSLAGDRGEQLCRRALHRAEVAVRRGGLAELGGGDAHAYGARIEERAG